MYGTWFLAASLARSCLRYDFLMDFLFLAITSPFTPLGHTPCVPPTLRATHRVRESRPPPTDGAPIDSGRHKEWRRSPHVCLRDTTALDVTHPLWDASAEALQVWTQIPRVARRTSATQSTETS